MLLNSYFYVTLGTLHVYLNNKNHKVQITDFEFISNVFMVSNGQDRY